MEATTRVQTSADANGRIGQEKTERTMRSACCENDWSQSDSFKSVRDNVESHSVYLPAAPTIVIRSRTQFELL
jgi:hypothetical protein